ncbi:MAG: PAS domain S-box protein [Bacteroidales bacterium]|nr:PAS domain S-box protein [Bacteroidales bacterium]
MNINKPTYNEIEHKIKELTEQLDFHYKVINSIDDILIIIDRNFQIEEINRAGLKFLGKKEKEVIGKTCYNVFHNLDSAVQNCPLCTSFKSKNEATTERNEEIHNKYFSIKSTPILDNSGDIIKFVNILRDISDAKNQELEIKSKNEEYFALNEEYSSTIEELKEKQAIIREKEQNMRELFENMPNCVAIYEAIDNGTNFIFKNINASAEKIEKCNRKDVIGKTVTEIFPGVEDFGLFKVFQEVWETGKTQFFPTSLYKDSSGREFWRENIVYKLPSGDIVAVYDDVTEKKLSELACQKNEARLEEAQKIAKLGHYILDIRTGFWNCSKELDNIFEITEKNVKDIEIWINVLHPDFKDEMITYFQDYVVRQKNKFDKEYKIIDLKGNEKWVHGLGDLKFDKEGNTIEMFGTIQDITTKKKTEIALRESEERYHTLFDTAKDSILIIRDNKFVSCNQSSILLFGYNSKEEFLLKTPWELSPEYQPDGEKSKTKAELYIKKALEGENQQFSWNHLKKDGTIFNAEISLNGVTIEGIKYVQTILRDVTERKIMEAKIKESEEKYKALYLNAPLAYQSLNSDGIIEDVNPAWLKILGYNHEEVIGKWFGDFVEKDDVDKFERNFALFKKRGKTNNSKLKLIKKDNSVIIVSFEGTVGYSDDGHFSKTYCTFKDITNEEIAKKELLLAKERAEESDKLKTAFLQNISHEFRTPMNGILGFSDLLINATKEDYKNNFFAEKIRESCDRLLDIVNDTVEISQVQSNIIQFSESICNLMDLINEITESITPKIFSKNLEFIRNTQNIEPNLNFITDKQKFSRLIRHLLENAVKFTEVGQIEFHCKIENSKTILIIVKDTGIGIAEEMQEKIFDPFRQIEVGATRNYGGNGIGLSLVKSYVEMFGGELKLVSTVGLGTEISVKIPLNESSVEIKKKNKSTEEIDLEDITILIVEDEDINFFYLNELFLDFGAEILHAKNGKEAVNFCIENNNIDLILMDIKTPVMNGYDASKEIKKIRPNLPIIAQTAYIYDNNTELDESTFDDFISKPINSKQLMRKISKLLNL